MTRNIIKTRIKTIIPSLLIVIVIFLLTAPSGSTSLDKLTATPLTSLPKELHKSPSIAFEGKNVHVVWNTEDLENSTIHYKRSLDNGKNWENTTQLTSNTTSAFYPAIAVYETAVHVVWIDYRHGNSEIYHIYSIDNGETWSTAQRLTYTNNSIRKDTIYDVTIAAKYNNIYLAWKDYRFNTAEIFFKKSRDNGNTWTADQRLTQDYKPSYFPSLAIDSTNLYIAFQDGGTKPDICLLKSNSSGEEWSEKTYIIDTQGASERPNLALSNNNLYLVWQDDRTGHREIYFKKSSNSGEIWGETQQLTFNSTQCINPNIYAYNEKVIVLWQDMKNESFDISYKISTDSGETWSEHRQLTKDSDCHNIKIVGEADNIHIVFQEYYEAGWTDIWHLGTGSQNPIVTSIFLSKTNVNLPGSIKITVDGSDSSYNKSELICIIQYTVDANDWENLDVTFINNQWETLLLLDNTSKTGNYTVRAQLVNPDDIQSEWEVFTDLKVLLNETSSETPGFELTHGIMIFILIAIMKIVYYNRKEKKR